MLQSVFLEEVAGLIRDAADLKTFKLGSSNQAPTNADGGLVGTQLLTVTGAVSQLGNTVTLEVANVPYSSGDAQECGIFNGAGVMLDRLVLPKITGQAGAELNFRYVLEVIDDGATL